jgi:hypothetical protein
VAHDAAGFAALAPSSQPAIALFAQDDLAYDAERDPSQAAQPGRDDAQGDRAAGPARRSDGKASS